MLSKTPKNSDKYFWTTHSIYKMRQYGLSEQKIRNIIKSPFRKEEGIVKNTVAVMQPASTRVNRLSTRGGPVNPKTDGQKKIWKQEIWVMYQISQNAKRKTQNIIQNPKYKIISAWRYPGISPERNPIPEEILREILEL